MMRLKNRGSVKNSTETLPSISPKSEGENQYSEMEDY